MSAARTRAPVSPLQEYAAAVQALAKARRKAGRRTATPADQAAVTAAERACVAARKRAAAEAEAARPAAPGPRPPWR